MDPENWMDGKIKSLVKIPRADFQDESAGYALRKMNEYCVNMNIEIERTTQTFSLQPLPRHFDEDTAMGRTSRQSKKSIFDSPRDMNSLHHEFVDNVLAFNTPDKIFDLIESFIDVCSESCKVSEGSRSKDRTWLENERNTWKLFYALYKNRLHHVSEKAQLYAENDHDIIKDFFENDNSIRECQIVVDWLEACEAARVDANVLPKVSHFTDKTIAWENTLHQIQIKNISYASSRDLVTSMDPDAPHREKRQLHDLDVEDETRLLEQVFAEIRCGRLKEALDICNLCGHKWRAAILQGWMLFNDPNYKHSDADSVISAFGNPHRDIWKYCAWQLTEKSVCSTMWKAIIGAFCGNLSVLLSACKKWEDLLWAYMRVYIDVKVEEEIRSKGVKSYVELPDQYWDFKFNVDEIFEEVAGFTDSNVRVEAAKPERLVQRLLITNRIPELVNVLADMCTSDGASVNLIRMSAHMMVCLRTFRLQYHPERIEEILVSYVQILIKTGDAKLVAFYTSTLSKENQIRYYSQFLENVEDENDRIRCLEIAEAYELPVDDITKYVVRVLRNKTHEPNDSISLSSGISKEDEEKISSLNLIMHYIHQRDEALWETNALVRYFLAQRNLQAANYAFCKVPENSIEIVLRKLDVDESLLETNPEAIPDKTFATIREYFCYKAYLNAEMKFADWFHCFHKEKPKKPQMPSEDSQFTQKVSYEQSIALYETEYAKWKSAINEQTSIVKSFLYNVLLFPDGGWLVENRYFDDKSRINQLNALRKLCIPKITILLHTVLSSMDMLDECLKLADIITSENHHIYKAYSVQDLGEILRKICDSSVEFLKQQRDPFGLQVSS